MLLFAVAVHLHGIDGNGKNIELVKGIPSELKTDSFFDMNKRNLMVINDQMNDTGGDKRIVNLFTRGSRYRNLDVIYIVQNVFHQGKSSRSISLKAAAKQVFDV